MSEQFCNTKSRYHGGVAKRRKRTYVKAARAQSETETRDRIVEAVVALHEEIGPLRTTISAIAGRAGVQRLTVYRHFPDENALIGACSARWTERQPPPDPAAVTAADPRRRAGELFVALYAYYRRGERMLEKIHADAPHMAVVRETLSPFSEYLDAFVQEIERGWRGRSALRTATLRHAVEFETWQSLSALTASDAESAELVLRWCEGLRKRGSG